MTASFTDINSLMLVCIDNIRIFNYLMYCFCHTPVTETQFGVHAIFTSILELVPLMNLMTTGFITSSTNKTSAIFHILGRRVDSLDKNCINYYIVPRYRSYLR